MVIANDKVKPNSTRKESAIMGMDVFGKNPKSEKGEYFRNNVWYWRPLWDYCCVVGSEVITDAVAEGCCYNDGVGLGAKDSARLSEILFQELWEGRTADFEKRHNEWLASLPRENCELCGATGIRTDVIGTDMGQPTRELSPEVQILTGRTHGWCNGCDGVGTRESFGMNYPFSIDNVREFAEFLAECGGFEVC